MNNKLETMELAAVRIAHDAELPQETAHNLNLLLQALLMLLRHHEQEIERLNKRVQELTKQPA